MYNVIGIGAGVFNLSLAALLSPLSKIKAVFLERNSKVSFNTGGQVFGSKMQMNFIKDLVTPVDPTNSYSLLNYLVTHRKIYPFATLSKNLTLKEFSDYLSWVSSKIDIIKLNDRVEEITFEDDRFCVKSEKNTRYSQHIVLGSGLVPHIPACAENYIGDTVTHSQNFLPWVENKKIRRVVVIGGGQSAAEIINHLINKTNVASIAWVNSNSNLWQLDDSPFVNDLYNPMISSQFYSLETSAKDCLLDSYNKASNGILIDTLQSLGRLIYERIHIHKDQDFFTVFHSHRLENLETNESGHLLLIKNSITGEQKSIEADQVILCTGYRYKIPDYLNSLIRIDSSIKRLNINDDFSLDWSKSSTNKIYVQNVGKCSHGIADPFIGLAAWRSATIINSLTGENIYEQNQLPLVPNTYI